MNSANEKDPRYKQMVSMQKRKYTNVEIGRQFGISRERVRQIIGNQPSRKSLVGRRFDHLTVTAEAKGPLVATGKTSRKLLLICSCDCGNKGVKRLRSSLHDSRSGIHSCGCASSGENCYSAKLTDTKVRDLREYCASHDYERGTLVAAAKKFGLHRVYTNRLIHGHARPEAGGPIKLSTQT